MFILSRLKFKAHFEKVKHNKLFIGMKYSEIRLVMVAILKLILLIESGLTCREQSGIH